jgi:hypothetical protein
MHYIVSQRLAIAIYGREPLQPGGGRLCPKSASSSTTRSKPLVEVVVEAVLDAGPQFRIVRKNPMGEMISIGSPAIVRSSLIIRTVSSLWKIAKPGAGQTR